MSKHSKNNTNSSVFTYMERQKLKAEYGTHNSRISQDSIKTFKMCTICNNLLIEPTACNEGHVFCRSCVVEFLVKQKKKMADSQLEQQKIQKKKQNAQREETLEKEVKKLEQFQKYDNFTQITGRQKLVSQTATQKGNQPKAVTAQDIKPTGIYELNPKKEQYVKTAFWTLQNTPINVDQTEKQIKVVHCPGGQHKLTLKKLRALLIREEEKEYCCWICRKEIQRQKVGTYKCGHVICLICKSNQCQVCQQKEGWMQLQNGASAFSAHNKSEVTTYTHAFVG